MARDLIALMGTLGLNLLRVHGIGDRRLQGATKLLSQQLLIGIYGALQGAPQTPTRDWSLFSFC